MREEIENWWKQAERDLKSAENCLKSGDYYLCAFMCHQSVEKALKALLMKKDRERFVPTHSLTELGKEVKAPPEIIHILRKLTPEYVISRYPDVSNGLPYENYDEDIAKDLLKKSKEVMEWMRKRL